MPVCINPHLESWEFLAASTRPFLGQVSESRGFARLPSWGYHASHNLVSPAAMRCLIGIYALDIVVPLAALMDNDGSLVLRISSLSVMMPSLHRQAFLLFDLMLSLPFFNEFPPLGSSILSQQQTGL